MINKLGLQKAIFNEIHEIFHVHVFRIHFLCSGSVTELFCIEKIKDARSKVNGQIVNQTELN